jgi:hypothetical protein
VSCSHCSNSPAIIPGDVAPSELYYQSHIMPASGPVGPSLSSSGRPSHSRHTSKSNSLASEQERELQQSSNHHRDKSKSSSHVHPRRESSAQLNNHASNSSSPPGTTQPQRPPLKARALSAPLVPKARVKAPARKNNPDIDQDASSNDPRDEEIADDPFFQRYSFPQTDETEEDPQPFDSREDEMDTAPLSPPSTQMRARPDSTAEPVGSPLSPRSPRSVRFPIQSNGTGILYAG